MARQIFYQEPAPIAVTATEPFGYIGQCVVTSLAGNFEGWSFFACNFSGANLTQADLHHTHFRQCTFSGAQLPAYIPSLEHELVRELVIQRLSRLTSAQLTTVQQMRNQFAQGTALKYQDSWTTIMPPIAASLGVTKTRTLFTKLLGDRPNIMARFEAALKTPETNLWAADEPEMPTGGFRCTPWGIKGMGQSWPVGSLPVPDRPHDRWDLSRKIEARLTADTAMT